jgi:hypothetical protein
LLALLLALGWASGLRADFRESFKKGIEAVDRKEWSDVARWMRQAAAEQPQEGESVKIYGVRFEPYLPHFYLGLALFQSGDCEGALEQWQLSESQKAVQSTSRYKLLVQNRDTCRQRIAAKKPNPPPTPSGPDPAAAAQAAREAEAREAARRKQEQEAETNRIREAEARRKQQEQEAAEAAAKIAEAKRRAEANREQAAHQEVTKSPQVAAADTPKKVEGNSGPPAELKAAARAFLRADYQEIVRTLGASHFQDRKATLASRLLLAAARYSLYLQGGEKDAELRKQATEDVRACRRLDAKIQPDGKLFSPRFTEFFRTAG